jgi:serine/threonine protein kinase
MAPESLSDGIFSPHSDIWSYGILLYEILTFGSFPYQGLSNNQVLEYVKNGNKLSIPQACTKEM